VPPFLTSSCFLNRAASQLVLINLEILRERLTRWIDLQGSITELLTVPLRLGRGLASAAAHIAPQLGLQLPCRFLISLSFKLFPRDRCGGHYDQFNKTHRRSS